MKNPKQRAPTVDIALATELRRINEIWSRTSLVGRRQWLVALLEPLCAPTSPAPPVAPGTLGLPSEHVVSRFLAACTKASPGSRVQAAKLYDVYVGWAEGAGEIIGTVTWLGRALAASGLRRHHSNSNWWLGIALTK